MGRNTDRRHEDCKNLLELFDQVEATTQVLHEIIARGLKIRNDEPALRKILMEIRDKL